MENTIEQRIRDLAQPLWESAARPYGMALDFWLMAEQMVIEMITASSQLHNVATSTQTPAGAWDFPEAAPVARIRDLAQCMWESAGRQYGMAQDFWLAAERHILAMMRAASATDSETVIRMRELAALPPTAYLERMNLVAYCMWEAAGRHYGHALDFWLQAERETLAAMATAAGVAAVSEPASAPVDQAASVSPLPSDVAGNGDSPMEASTSVSLSEPELTAATEPYAAADEPAAPPAKVAQKPTAKAPRSPRRSPGKVN